MYFLVLLAFSAVVRAGSVTNGNQCNQGDNRLQTGTYQFWSDCTATTYCADSGICQPRGCRRDDFPFGYAQGSHEIPDKCPRGLFCPDEGSGCQTLLAVGSQCQLNRDGTVPHALPVPPPAHPTRQTNARRPPTLETSQTPPAEGSTSTDPSVSTTSACGPTPPSRIRV